MNIFESVKLVCQRSFFFQRILSEVFSKTSLAHVQIPASGQFTGYQASRCGKRIVCPNSGFISKVYFGKTVRKGNNDRGRGAFDINTKVAIYIISCINL